jgi:hypothetical protein
VTTDPSLCLQGKSLQIYYVRISHLESIMCMDFLAKLLILHYGKGRGWKAGGLESVVFGRRFLDTDGNRIQMLEGNGKVAGN